MLNERPLLVLICFLIFCSAILVSGTLFIVRADGHVELTDQGAGALLGSDGSIFATSARAGALPLAERERQLVSGERLVTRLKLRQHEIQGGENLWMIARQYGIDINTILGCNEGLSEQGVLAPGREIMIPNQKGILYRLKYGQYLSDLSAAYNIRLEGIFHANGIANAKDVKEDDLIFMPGAEPLAPNSKRLKLLESRVILTTFLKPLKGRLTTKFGWRIHPIRKKRDFHRAIDLAAFWGTKVKAAQDGKVTYAGWKAGYGYFIKIKHRFGYTTAYGHLTAPLAVKSGEQVKRGQVIGLIGATGTATGSHLHFEMHQDGRAVNPLRYLDLS